MSLDSKSLRAKKPFSICLIFSGVVCDLLCQVLTGPAEQVLKWRKGVGGGGGGVKGTLKREALKRRGVRGHASAKNLECKSSKMGGKCLKIGHRM